MIPDVSLVDTELKPVKLADAVAKGKTVLAFFPGAFTSVCTKEMCTFRDDLSKLGSLNARVIAISVDGPFAGKGFKEKNGLNFTLLSDYNRDAVRAFGIELNDFAGLKGYVAAKRSVFIVDNGIVKYKWVSNDPKVEPKYQEIESALG
jgi:peroxiredoxin